MDLLAIFNHFSKLCNNEEMKLFVESLSNDQLIALFKNFSPSNQTYSGINCGDMSLNIQFENELYEYLFKNFDQFCNKIPIENFIFLQVEKCNTKKRKICNFEFISQLLQSLPDSSNLLNKLFQWFSQLKKFSEEEYIMYLIQFLESIAGNTKIEINFEKFLNSKNGEYFAQDVIQLLQTCLF